MKVSSGQPPILVITGPTATGKTSLAIEVAEELGTEIISADSMQVYRGMDIGTAKPTPGEMGRVPHYLVDVADPQDPFSVADFCRLAVPLVQTRQKEGKPLVVCGGTGLYLKSLFDGLAEGPPPDFEFRAAMEDEAERKGTDRLYERLRDGDPEAARKIHPNDRKRIIRALEILQVSGMTKSEFETMQIPPSWRRNVVWFGLIGPWEDLDERIGTRVVEMFEKGLVEEVRGLVREGCSLRHTSMQGLGYKEILEHFEGLRDLEETCALVQQRTRRFARRQMTWFRPNKRIHWLEAPFGQTRREVLHRNRDRILQYPEEVSHR